MSTRCLIGKENKDKSITYIYCHHDGYITGVGKQLVEYYDDLETVNKLLALGDLSVLGNKTIVKEFDYQDPNRFDYCEPYSLRGEECPARTVKNEDEYSNQDRGQEYCYLYRDGEWQVLDLSGNFVSLAEELKNSKK